MNREAPSPPLPPRPPRRWKSRTSSTGLSHIAEAATTTNSKPCRTKSSDELDADLLTPYPHTTSDDDDVSMTDAMDDVASVGSFSHCSGDARAPLVSTDSSMSFSRPRRHVSATDSCLSIFSTDSLHQMRFIAPNNSFTPQDIIMMEDEERIRSTSFRLSFSSNTNPVDEQGEMDNKKVVVDSTTSTTKQQPSKPLPFATNLGLPDFHASSVSYEEGETTKSTRQRPLLRKKTSIYRAPTTTTAPTSA